MLHVSSFTFSIFPVETRQLEAFAAVMSAGSVTGAARLLDVLTDIFERKKK